MKITDIKVNTRNHAQFNVELSFGINSRKALDANMSLNEYLDIALRKYGNLDYGGKYATYLDDIGIPSNSDFGWWSIAAVDARNIQFFVDSCSDIEKEAAYQKAKKNYQKLSDKISHNCKTITEFIELFQSI